MDPKVIALFLGLLSLFKAGLNLGGKVDELFDELAKEIHLRSGVAPSADELKAAFAQVVAQHEKLQAAAGNGQ